MKTNKSRKPRKPSNSIKTLSTVLQCTSFSTFLIVGLSGCNAQDDCNKTWSNSKTPMNQSKDCQESRGYSGYSGYSGSSSSSHSSGFFAPIGHSTSSSHLGG